MAENFYWTNGDVILMNFSNIDWADSDLESVCIEYDRAVLCIWNDTLQKRMKVNCSGLAGMTNLCLWDDTIIMKANVYDADENCDSFVQQLLKAYGKDIDYGGRSLSNGLLELRIELANYISFSVYCLQIDVIECEE